MDTIAYQPSKEEQIKIAIKIKKIKDSISQGTFDLSEWLDEPIASPQTEVALEREVHKN